MTGRHHSLEHNNILAELAFHTSASVTVEDLAMNFEELTGGDLALVTGGSCLNDKVKFNRMGRELISYHCALFLQVIASYMNLLGRDVSQVTDVLCIIMYLTIGSNDNCGV